MSWVAAAVVGSAVVGGAVANNASKRAAGAQTAAAQSGIEEQQRQFDKVQELLKPYVEAGQPALAQQQALLGLSGPQAYQQAIAGLTPQVDALAQQGEQAIRANASATGGLRGGNVQAALAQYRPQILNSLINQQYGRLAGLTQMGQNSAAGVGTAGMNTGNQITSLLQQQGAAGAGGALAQGQIGSNLITQIGGLGASYLNKGNFGGQPVDLVSGSGLGVTTGYGGSQVSGIGGIGGYGSVGAATPGYGYTPKSF